MEITAMLLGAVSVGILYLWSLNNRARKINKPIGNLPIFDLI
jgi:hypothetical protein